MRRTDHPIAAQGRVGSNSSAVTSVPPSEIIRSLPLLAVPGCVESQRPPRALAVVSATRPTMEGRLQFAPTMLAMRGDFAVNPMTHGICETIRTHFKHVGRTQTSGRT